MKTIHIKTLIALCAALTVTALAIAKDGDKKFLGAKAANDVISGRTWQANKVAASGQSYWTWKSDGSVCLREGSKSGKCDDTGRWKLEGDRFCYELTWWGKSIGLDSACFRIADQGKGHYLGIKDNGLEGLSFSVLK